MIAIANRFQGSSLLLHEVVVRLVVVLQRRQLPHPVLVHEGAVNSRLAATLGWLVTVVIVYSSEVGGAAHKLLIGQLDDLV